jgi:D-alanine-D-alanine ligase
MKSNIALICGGANTEYEVSIASAQSIINHIDYTKHTLVPIKITKHHQWQSTDLHITKPTKISTIKWQLTNPINALEKHKIDTVLSVLHGRYGEDGTLQGLLEMVQIPYVGCDVKSSAVCMDKDLQRKITSSVGIRSVKYLTVTRSQWDHDEAQWTNKITSQIKFPCFVKPANSGSSIGISKVSKVSQVEPAVIQAFQYDHKIIIEQAVIKPREIECAIIGNHTPKASVLGEISYTTDFYNYQAKYTPNAATLQIPAMLPQLLSQSITQTALKAYKVLGCSGLARIDFLLDSQKNVLYLSEVNTIPGFTSTSMFPLLWQHSGISYSKLITALINYADSHFNHNQQIKKSYMQE